MLVIGVILDLQVIPLSSLPPSPVPSSTREIVSNNIRRKNQTILLIGNRRESRVWGQPVLHGTTHV
jgi:hypothetical protein